MQSFRKSCRGPSGSLHGVDLLVGTYNYLDLTPLGRQEDWEEPPGRSDSPFLAWVRRHDEYEGVKGSASCCGSGAHQNAGRIHNQSQSPSPRSRSASEVAAHAVGHPVPKHPQEGKGD